MAAQTDFTTGKAGIAYRGATPWHGHGQRLTADATIDDWRKESGLDWECERAPVFFDYNRDGEQKEFVGKDVLFRSDTKAPLSVVSSEYKIAQPGQIMGFFNEVAKNGNFQMETAGSLFDGRRIWGLARVSENASIKDDLVAPYLMMATSYDGTMSTVAQFTTVRIVCNNTLQQSLHTNNGKTRVTIPHSAMFNAKSIQAELGLAESSWDNFMATANRMARTKINDAEMNAYLQMLLDPEQKKDPVKVINSKGYGRIMALFHGDQIGSGMDAIKGTVWGALQATAEYVDWEVGRKQDLRLDSAWLGVGARFKLTASELLGKIAA